METYIPKKLDQAERFLIFELDQIVMFVTIFGIAMALDMPTIGLIAGFFLTWLFGRLKSGKHPRFLLHLMYWNLPSNVSIRLRATPPSHDRHFLA